MNGREPKRNLIPRTPWNEAEIEKIKAAGEGLSPRAKRRRAIILRLWEGGSAPEVAAAVRVSASSVTNALKAFDEEGAGALDYRKSGGLEDHKAISLKLPASWHEGVKAEATRRGVHAATVLRGLLQAGGVEALAKGEGGAAR